MEKVKVHYKSKLGYCDIAYFLKDYISKDTVIICIGTDKCIGDSLGPMIGTMLTEKNFPLPLYGTIAYPIHALNLEKKLNEIKLKHPNCRILGIDASLGENEAVGEIHCRDYAIRPGKGVGKILPEVGEFSIIGIIDSWDNTDIFSSRTIRLNLIMEMSKVIVDGLIYSYYLSNNSKG